MTKNKIVKNIKPITAVYSFLAIILLYVAVVAVLVYGFGIHNFFVDKTTGYLPFPAAIVNKSGFVTMRDLNNDLIAVRRFYENQNFSSVGIRVDFSTPDGQKRLKIKEKELLNKLIENKIIEKLAIGRGITVTDETVSQNVDREMAQYGDGSEVSKTLFNLYGWSIDDFKEKIVKPDMYKSELEKNVKETDESFTNAKTKITQAQEELKNKADFAEVAKKYSEGDSATNGGDLGWFAAGQMMPEIAVPAFLMKKGEQSDVIESSLGFHIIQVDDKKTEDGIDKVKIRQILVRTKSFPDWLFEQEKNMSVSIPIKDYSWNKETAMVEFKSQEMKDFEKNLGNNSAGDISVAF